MSHAIAMSPALAVALLLLLAVVGLTLLQRRGTRDMTGTPAQGPDRAGPSRGTARAPGPASVASVVDPVLGDLTFDGRDAWTRDEDLSLGGHDVAVRVLAGPEGPQDMHRAWMQAALDRYDALDTEARTVLATALAPLGLCRADLTPWQIAIGPADGQTACEGRLYYDSMHEAVDEAYVRSTAMWDHLEPHLEMSGDALEGPPVPERLDPLLGTIVYSGEESWSNAEPFRFGGRNVSVVLMAGPEGPTPEHDAWLQALASRDAVLLAEATILARSLLPTLADSAALTMSIAVIGPDEHGRFIGGLCFDWPDRGAARCDVWSRDRWATLRPDRG